MMDRSDTIAALATGAGGAIAVIRVSGQSAIAICQSIFRSAHGTILTQAKGYTMHLGDIVDEAQIVDEVLVALMRAPRSYTGEDMVEISCHASPYITREILRLLIASGARMAQAGEFTTRAFLAGKIDLAQAEAVADMIAAESRAAHSMATKQLKGGYSSEFTLLRERLIELLSLLELELDFSDEDVEFADRRELREAITNITTKTDTLLRSFSLGNAIKQGVATAIVGRPNVGKSTLLNRLLMDERAMVSDIAGTTRDVIEEQLTIDGIRFRFIDTAGIRNSDDPLEQMGIERTFTAIGRASIVILLCAPDDTHSLAEQIEKLGIGGDQKLIVAIGKSDLQSLNAPAQEHITQALSTKLGNITTISLSAKTGDGIQQLCTAIKSSIMADATSQLYGSTVVSDSRHYEALTIAHSSLLRAQSALQEKLPTEFISQDLRSSLHHLGQITGQITTNDILGSIFSKFCIGK